jgi:tetratricopeptide (TPR) repeat protein
LDSAAIPVALVFLLVLVSWRVLYSFNRDLVRARAWGALTRRSFPFVAMTLMAMSVFFIHGVEESWILATWAGVFGVAVILSNLLAMPASERKANKAFRTGNYEEAATRYRELVEESPLARHYAFLGAALAADERRAEAIESLTRATELDPEYGIAYYNRALVQRQEGRRGRAIKDLRRALEADLPRRFRGTARSLLKELK